MAQFMTNIRKLLSRRNNNSVQYVYSVNVEQVICLLLYFPPSNIVSTHAKQRLIAFGTLAVVPVRYYGPEIPPYPSLDSHNIVYHNNIMYYYYLYLSRITCLWSSLARLTCRFHILLWLYIIPNNENKTSW